MYLPGWLVRVREEQVRGQAILAVDVKLEWRAATRMSVQAKLESRLVSEQEALPSRPQATMSRPPAPGTSSPGPPRGGVGHVKGGGQIQQHHGHSSNALAAGAGAADVPPLVKELKELLSQPVRLVLVDGKQHTGLLWAIDTGIGVAVLEIPKASIPAVKTSLDDYPTTAAAYPTSSLSSVKVAAQGGDASGSRTNFQIVKLQRMARVEKLQGPQAAALEKAKMTEITRDVNVAAAEARERAATTEALKRATKIGVGVSSLAQEVFDALSKTLPCRWADRHIIVMDEIVIVSLQLISR